MSDINLLPEDLKKKNKNSFKKGNTFNNREVEFTSGASLKKDYEDDEIDAVDKLFNWVRPKVDDKNNIKNRNINIPAKQNLVNDNSQKIEEKSYKATFDKSNNKTIIKDKKQNLFSRLFVKQNTGKDLKKEAPKNIIDTKNYSIKKELTNDKKHFDFSENFSNGVKSINPMNQNNISGNLSEQNTKNNFNQFKNIVDNNIRNIQGVNVINPQNNIKTENNNIINNKIKYSSTSKKSKFSFKDFFGIKKSRNEIISDKNSELGVNLLPEGINVPSGKNLFFALLSTLIVSCMVIMVVYFALTIYEMKLIDQYKNMDTEVDNYESNVKDYDDLISEIQSWQTKIDNIKNLFSHHVYWTKFFEIIEENTLPDIKYSGFGGSINGNLTLSAQAPNYETVVKQWTYWNNAENFVDKVIIGGASLSSNGASEVVNFSVTFDFVDDIFYKSTELQDNKKTDNN